MEKEEELRPFTHRIYCDFSGDDGLPSTLGSTKTMCMAYVMSKEEDISHNNQVVYDMKKIIGCRKSDELKYTTLRRHRFKDRALSLLSEAKMDIILAPVIKERIKEHEISDPSTKRLVTLVHTFPLGGILRILEARSLDAYFQLIFDDITWSGSQDLVREDFKGYGDQLDWKNARPDWLIFRKSGSQSMLQLADVIAGMGREYFDSLYEEPLPPCQACYIRQSRNRTCRWLRRRDAGVGKSKLLRLLYPKMMKSHEDWALGIGLIVRPPEIESSYLFVDCLIGRKGFQ